MSRTQETKEESDRAITRAEENHQFIRGENRKARTPSSRPWSIQCKKKKKELASSTERQSDRDREKMERRRSGVPGKGKPSASSASSS
jgi:hypothetical protein